MYIHVYIGKNKGRQGRKPSLHLQRIRFFFASKEQVSMKDVEMMLMNIIKDKRKVEPLTSIKLPLDEITFSWNRHNIYCIREQKNVYSKGELHCILLVTGHEYTTHPTSLGCTYPVYNPTLPFLSLSCLDVFRAQCSFFFSKIVSSRFQGILISSGKTVV